MGSVDVMKLRQLLRDVDIIEIKADVDMEITGVCHDSRLAQEGNVFVAVSGFESDGHRFISAAAEMGASVCICEKQPECSIPYVLTFDSRRALAQVSAAWFKYPAKELKLIGVTGTNGKTTTTSLIKQIIEKTTGEKAGLIGTIANYIGDREIPTERTTPESYGLQELLREMVDEGCRYAIMEVSSHSLVLDRVFGLEFEAGVFTNLTRDHLDFHKTMEDYAAAKSILFSRSKHSVINIDDEYSEMMIGSAAGDVLTYSIDDDRADLCAKRVRYTSDGVDFSALMTGALAPVRLAIPGKFSVYNALSAMGACVSLGLDVGKVADALSECRGVKGRAEVVPAGKEYSVIIDYAHTPDGLHNIISTLKGVCSGRVITLFGCGGDRDRTKRPIMGKVAADESDFVIVTSDNPRTEEPGAIIGDILPGLEGTKTPYVVIENREEAIKWGLENAEPGDILLLAGKGHETYQIVGHKKRHFDEREIVMEALK